mmetsp:Transcript_9346/g.16260  ORF Transcript_9346/g.16260 Transcript_9346/m.16260 type:complete len:172 (+) Transcript_9346:105-620(+)
MKEAYADKKKQMAAKAGLEAETIDSSVCDRTAKVALVAAAMGNSGLSFSNKKLLTKTESRFIAEHSIMGGYAYATTVLSTHFIEGPRPRCLSKYRPEKLNRSAKETVEWVRQALDAEVIHPINPNLLLSTDDTTLFVFEGYSENSEDWEWKLIDKSQGNSSVRSDFEVGYQ